MSIPWTSRYVQSSSKSYGFFCFSQRPSGCKTLLHRLAEHGSKRWLSATAWQKCRNFPIKILPAIGLQRKKINDLHWTEKTFHLFVGKINRPKKKVSLVDLAVDLGEKADWTLTHAYVFRRGRHRWNLRLLVNLGLSMVSPFNFSNQSMEAKHPSKSKNRLKQQDFPVGVCGWFVVQMVYDLRNHRIRIG